MEYTRNEIARNGVDKPGLVATGLLYSVVSFLLLIVGSQVQKRDFYSGILITEFILILLPPLLLLFVQKYDVRKVLRLNRIGFLNLFIIFFIMVFSLWIVNILNLFNLWAIKSIFGQVIMPSIPATQTNTQLLVNILVIGGAAGICEEVLFRGVIQRSLERFGAFVSIFATGVLFGLFHMDFQRFLGTFLLGTLIGYIVYRTNSLYGGIFAHFVNNSLAVLISYAASRLLPLDLARMQSSENHINDYFDTLSSMPPVQLMGVIIVWVISVFFCGAALAGLIFALNKNNPENKKYIHASRPKKILPAILAFSPGLLAIAGIYVIIGYALSGVQIDIRSLLGLFGL